MQKSRFCLAMVISTMFGCGSRLSVGDLGGGATTGVGQTSPAGAGQFSGGPTAGGASVSTGGTSAGGASVSYGGSTSVSDGGASAGGVSVSTCGTSAGGASTTVLACGTIEYSATAFYGVNILDPSATAFTGTPPSFSADHDFSATLSAGASLRIRMTDLDPIPPGTGSGGTPGSFAAPFGPDNSWYVGTGNGSDWLVSDFNTTTGVQVFEAHDTQKTLDMQFGFGGNGRALVEYFECDSATPTRTNTITWSTITP